jgi:hypothetical protein
MNFQIVCDGHDHPLCLLTKKIANLVGLNLFFATHLSLSWPFSFIPFISNLLAQLVLKGF